jgi:hypothetical protein
VFEGDRRGGSRDRIMKKTLTRDEFEERRSTRPTEWQCAPMAQARPAWLSAICENHCGARRNTSDSEHSCAWLLAIDSPRPDIVHDAVLYETLGERRRVEDVEVKG